jgi:SpoVK/Ycf46/Vps4 family AAA+-type ATPase
MTIINNCFSNISGKYPVNPNNKQNNRSNISFGYDVLANDQLKYNAKEENLSDLLKLQNLCNSMENTIRDKENTTGNFSEKELKLMENLFYPLKKILAKNAEINFPEIKFSEKEIDHYNQETKEKKYKNNMKSVLWRMSIIEHLAGNASPDKVEEKQTTAIVPVKNTRPVTPPKKINDESNNIDKISTDNIPKKDHAPQILEEFKPSKTSPKGFNDVAGHENLKKDLTDFVIAPIKSAAIRKELSDYGLPMLPNGILLYGPPGCGKTLLAEALASEAKLPMFKLKISLVGTKYIHETSNNIESAFNYIEKRAKQEGKPCILFIDEIDSIATIRDDSDITTSKREEVSTLLTKLNNISDKNIILIGATNNRNAIDPAILRPGRFDKEICLGLPDSEGRKRQIILLLSNNKKTKQIKDNEKELNDLVKATDGFTNAQIKEIFQEAARKAYRDHKEMQPSDIIASSKNMENNKYSQESLTYYGVKSPNSNKESGLDILYA